MSAFSGPQAKGAMRKRRELKRLEANERNARTPWTRTKIVRRQVKANRAEVSR
jgi:hypothetical protein